MASIKTTYEDFISLNDDESLLKCLNKILSYLKSNEKSQKDVFINLSDRGLNKLLLGMKNQNLEIRVLSLRLLLDLLFNNEVLQNIFCEKFNFNPVGSVICINWFPKCLRDNVIFNEKLIIEIKKSISVLNSKRLKYWMWPSNFKYNDDQLPDPMKYLVGFYFSSKSSIQKQLKSSKTNINSHTQENIGENTSEKSADEIDIRNLNFKLEKIIPDSIMDNNSNLVGDKVINDQTLKKKVISAGSGSESASKITKKIVSNKKMNIIDQNSLQSRSRSNNKAHSIINDNISNRLDNRMLNTTQTLPQTINSDKNRMFSTNYSILENKISTKGEKEKENEITSGTKAKKEINNGKIIGIEKSESSKIQIDNIQQNNNKTFHNKTNSMNIGVKPNLDIKAKDKKTTGVSKNQMSKMLIEPNSKFNKVKK